MVINTVSIKKKQQSMRSPLHMPLLKACLYHARYQSKANVPLPQMCRQRNTCEKGKCLDVSVMYNSVVFCEVTERISRTLHCRWCKNNIRLWASDFWCNSALPINDRVIFCCKMLCYSLIIFKIDAVPLYETGPIQSILYRHSGYWWPDALAPGLQ